jgi:thymidine phosphorylase
MSDAHSRLRLVRAGIDTYQQPVVYMHRDCHVCRSEGFTALTRVLARSGDRELVATLNVVVDNRLDLDVAALSEAAWALLQPSPDARALFSHPEPPASAPALRAKVFGQRLGETDFLANHARHRQHPFVRHRTDRVRNGMCRRAAR